MDELLEVNSLMEAMWGKKGELCLRDPCVRELDLSKQMKGRSMSRSKVLGQYHAFIFSLGFSYPEIAFQKKMQNAVVSPMQMLINIFLERKNLRMKLKKPQHQIADDALGLYICETGPFF